MDKNTWRIIGGILIIISIILILNFKGFIIGFLAGFQGAIGIVLLISGIDIFKKRN